MNEPPSSLVNEIRRVEKYRGMKARTTKIFWVKIINRIIKIKPNGYNENIISSNTKI